MNPLQARIAPLLSIRHFFERRLSSEEAVEDGDRLHRRASPSTSGRWHTSQKDGSGLRLPHSLAPWHTLPFMSQEVSTISPLQNCRWKFTSL